MKKKPNLVLAVDDFGFYVGAIHNKSFDELSDEEFTKYKNDFVLALEEELYNIHKFAKNFKGKEINA